MLLTLSSARSAVTVCCSTVTLGHWAWSSNIGRSSTSNASSVGVTWHYRIQQYRGTMYNVPMGVDSGFIMECYLLPLITLIIHFTFKDWDILETSTYIRMYISTLCLQHVQGHTITMKCTKRIFQCTLFHPQTHLAHRECRSRWYIYIISNYKASALYIYQWKLYKSIISPAVASTVNKHQHQLCHMSCVS